MPKLAYGNYSPFFTEITQYFKYSAPNKCVVTSTSLQLHVLKSPKHSKQLQKCLRGLNVNKYTNIKKYINVEL